MKVNGNPEEFCGVALGMRMLPETQLFPLDSDTFSLPDLVIQIDDEVFDEPFFGLRFEMSFRDLQYLFNLLPCQPTDSF